MTKKSPHLRLETNQHESELPLPYMRFYQRRMLTWTSMRPWGGEPGFRMSKAGSQTRCLASKHIGPTLQSLLLNTDRSIAFGLSSDFSNIVASEPVSGQGLPLICLRENIRWSVEDRMSWQSGTFTPIIMTGTMCGLTVFRSIVIRILTPTSWYHSAVISAWEPSNSPNEEPKLPT